MSKKLHPLPACLLAAATSLCTTPGLAQTATLRETVVTSTRVPTRVDQQLTDVTVLTGDDIRRSGILNVTDLLNSLPGVQATPPGVRGANASVFIRGNNHAHTLVLVDGQRISSATTGATAIQHIPLEQIERIEVIRGPASSLYGSDAIGGVIQVFTKGGTGAPTLTGALDVGSYGTVSASAGYGGRVGDTAFHVQVGGERSRGFSDIRDANGGPFDSFNPDADGYRQSNLGLSASHRITPDLEVGAKYLLTHGRKRSDALNCDLAFTACTADFDNRDDQQLEAFNVHADYHVTADWRSVLRVGASRDDLRSWMFDPVAVQDNVSRYTTRQRQVSWQNDFRLGPGVLMAALESRQVRVASTQTFVRSDQETTSLSLGYQAWMGPHLLQASARHDRISGFEPANTGTAGYGYKFAEGWIARASAGTGFHAPSFNDLYWPFDPVNFFVGNPALRPERSKNLEVAVGYDIAPVRFSVTAYHNKVKDLIQLVTNQTTFISTMENVSSATLQGVTLDGSYQMANWTFSGHYDVLSARNDSTGNTLQRRTPRWGTIDVAHRSGKLQIGTRLDGYSHRYNDAENTQRLGGYMLLGLRAAYDVAPGWTLTASINNALDKQYVVNRVSFTPFSDYGTAGRSFFVGVRYTGG
ncbi:TonB-dependent receptor [Ramlibacter sp. PS3R-8]|uniref:TonB-dependent receptor domain-containing protein n=1 Tax=Ramlibacter sp. PS3R-8 TaxID=3133437 RepID=UPI0030A9A016